ncbi:MAG: TIGR02391 family protein [Candidatus Methanoperedens sp.]
MVPVNFHRYREHVRQAIFHRKASLGTEWDPLIAAWMAYALLQDGLDQNPHLSELIQDIERWAQNEEVWNIGRNLGPLCLLGYLQQLQGLLSPENASRLLGQIRVADSESKFSPFRAPEQIFLVALLISSLDNAPDDAKKLLISIIGNQLNGPLQRRIMFLAAGNELGMEGQLYIPPDTSTDAGDVIGLIWWHERYGKSEERNKWWKAFDNISDTISVTEESATNETSEIRILSSWEIAMLYEALVKETTKPDPSMLFNLYPLHPRIKSIAEPLFNKEGYFDAIFEATKALNNFIREKTGSHDSETTLVRNVIGDPSKEIKNPKIKFNPLDLTSPDYKSQQNEQRGLSYLAHGIFFAFRHPKGHEPKDTRWGNITPYEALDQLVVISYLMKRIEEAK